MNQNLTITEREIVPYIDEFGLIVQKKTRDGGDTANRMGHTWFTLFILLIFFKRRQIYNLFAGLIASPKEVFLMLQDPKSPGNYRRHCCDHNKEEKDLWTDDFDRWSRDQAQSMVALMGICDKKRLWQHFIAHVKRFGFMTNTKRNGSTKLNHGEEYKPGERRNYDDKLPDFAFSPEWWGLYIRSFAGWFSYLLYPLLILADLETLIGSVKWRWFTKESNNDITNHLMMLVLSTYQMPTGLHWISWKIIGYDMTMKKLHEYWEGKEDPTFVAKLYEPIVKKHAA